MLDWEFFHENQEFIGVDEDYARLIENLNGIASRRWEEFPNDRYRTSLSGGFTKECWGLHLRASEVLKAIELYQGYIERAEELNFLTIFNTILPEWKLEQKLA